MSSCAARRCARPSDRTKQTAGEWRRWVTRRRLQWWVSCAHPPCIGLYRGVVPTSSTLEVGGRSRYPQYTRPVPPRAPRPRKRPRPARSAGGGRPTAFAAGAVECVVAGRACITKVGAALMASPVSATSSPMGCVHAGQRATLFLCAASRSCAGSDASLASRAHLSAVARMSPRHARQHTLRSRETNALLSAEQAQPPRFGRSACTCGRTGSALDAARSCTPCTRVARRLPDQSPPRCRLPQPSSQLQPRRRLQPLRWRPPPLHALHSRPRRQLSQASAAPQPTACGLPRTPLSAQRLRPPAA